MDVKIPSQGVAMTEAVLNTWLKQPGDVVAEGDALAEIETDKTTLELEAPVAGRLGPHLVGEGDIVEVGVTIVQVLENSETAAYPPAEVKQSIPVPAPGPAAEAVPTTAAAQQPALSRRARALAQQAAAAPVPPAPAPPKAPGAGTPQPKFRALIAERVAESWRTIPHFTVTREIAAGALVEQLRLLRTETPGLTLTDLMVVALGRALAETGTADPVDVGVAVATEHGVMIPVVTDVSSGSFATIAEQRARAVERARAGRLVAQDLRTPACTLSNLGAFGVDQFTGIIAIGQLSLLTVGRVAPRVVAADGNVAVRETFYATVNADHRSLDGADAARLLAAFANACGSTRAAHQEA